MIYFLSSLPRSGSTLLASLLEQRNDTYVSGTSDLCASMWSLCLALESYPTKNKNLRNVLDAQYQGIHSEFIFDKGRQWPFPHIMETVQKIYGKMPKIVATVRPMVECIISFYQIDKSHLPIEEWIKTSPLMEHLVESYNYLSEGYEKYPDSFCLIEYDNLVDQTQVELNRISDFIGADRVTFNPNIQQVEDSTKDNEWGLDGMHTLRTTIERDTFDPRTVLGLNLYNEYTSWDFWTDTQKYHPWTYGETTKQFIEA